MLVRRIERLIRAFLQAPGAVAIQALFFVVLSEALYDRPAMGRLKVTVLDLVTNGPRPSPFSRLMNANRASIMPQAAAVWCERSGHDVRFICYTGIEDLERQLSGDLDVLIVGSFTRSAQLAYAVSRLCRDRGAVTVLGGPHARSYPEDAARYFDYVLGLTDRELLDQVLQDAAPQRPLGLCLSARRQPRGLPSVRERWKFIEPTIAKARVLKLVPMIASMGCPYTCDFCIDAEIDYQPLDLDDLREDLRFLVGKLKRPFVGWHDPNFGVRFDDYVGAIEEAVPRGSVSFAAESSLSLLSEPNLKRLAAAGFKAILPGIESWFSHGNKSKTGSETGMAKVERVAEHVNLMLEHVPYVQANFVLGLDCDQGAEPFELTKRFASLAPGVFPAFSLLTSYGRGSPLNLELQRAGRVLPFPFHFLNSSRAMNVRPLHYTWPEFYGHVTDLTRFSLSWRQVARRFMANGGWTARWLNLVRGLPSRKPRYYAGIRRMLDTDVRFRRYFEGETRELPEFYAERIRRDLGPFWSLLPDGALEHRETAWIEELDGSGEPARAPAKELPSPAGEARAATDV